MKYIGIRKQQSHITVGNYNDIWEQQEDGYFKCTNNSKKKHKLTEEQILHDVKLGYLKILKNDERGNSK